VPYDPTIYRGSAPHYAVGRPPYSLELERTLAETLDLDGRGRLLDAGCGPGILALRLAHLFEQVVGLDPDPDMLAEAARQTAERKMVNAAWVQARAEELPEAAPGPYRLVTLGQSLHWTDEHRVAEVVYDLLEPGGFLALIVHTVGGRPAPPNPAGLFWDWPGDTEIIVAGRPLTRAQP
jgi:ubiquinone/menaquinone biosynthesis C-methylase UbiE